MTAETTVWDTAESIYCVTIALMLCFKLFSFKMFIQRRNMFVFFFAFPLLFWLSNKYLQTYRPFTLLITSQSIENFHPLYIMWQLTICKSYMWFISHPNHLVLFWVWLMVATWLWCLEWEVNNESPTAVSEFPTALKVIKLHAQARHECTLLLL